MKNPSSLPLVYVQWSDAVSDSGGWNTYEEALEWSDPDALVIHQVGWLVEDTDTHILLASRIAHQNEDSQEQYGHLQMIPKGWVKITPLR